jgi:small subunit ribosomal protein S3
MTHKTHPKIYRIKGMESWTSKGFYGKDMVKKLEEDFKIRKFLEEKIGSIYIEKIEIERELGKINAILYTSRPGVIIGKKGQDVEKLKNEIENKILKQKGVLRIEVREVPNPWACATLVAKWMANQVEKRVPYRKVLKAALAKVSSQKEVLGVRVQLKGRLDGNEIARREWMQKGRLPRQNLRAQIDYGEAQAFCTYGVVGAKVWIFKGEKFE